MENGAVCPHRGYVDIWNCILLQSSKHFGVKDGKGRRSVAYNSYKMNGIPCPKKCHN